jgi:hypothetical protein
MVNPVFRSARAGVFCSAAILILLSGFAQAAVAPFYTYGEAFARTGEPDHVVLGDDSDQGTGPQTVTAGNRWWCEVPNCGITLQPGDRSAWGEVNTDPANGTLGARAGSMAYDAYGGYGDAYGYISQVFRVVSDGTLQPGDAVILDLSMALKGVIDSNASGQVGGLVTVNHYDAAHQYQDGLGRLVDYMPRETFEDLIFSPDILDQMPGFVRYYGNAMNPGPVDFSGTDGVAVQVGDLVILEGMLLTTNTMWVFQDDLTYSWIDFDNTLSSSLTPVTAGATLSAVPLPPALYLFASSVMLLLTRARRKRALTATA